MDKLDNLLSGPINSALAAVVALKGNHLDEFLSVGDVPKSSTRSRSDENVPISNKENLDKRNAELRKDSKDLELDYKMSGKEYTLNDIASELVKDKKYKKIDLSKERIRRLITRKYPKNE